jgi:serine/threonine protein kinase
MGTVHEAMYCPEGGFERRVAVKRLHPHMAAQERLVSEFRREAALSARLVHPNIVQVFDFGRVGDSYFLAMEYVDGMTLRTAMRRFRSAEQPIAPEIVAHVAREILAALAYSHDAARGSDGARLRIIHRDLSPANVLLGKSGEVKLTDFGLARALRDAASTRTRTVAGHVGYMAPEQARGESLDERCDLFSVGVILWEMLAGTRLFLRESEPASLLSLVADPVPAIRSLRPDVADGWQDLLDRALAREPGERMGSAAEMAAAIEALSPARGREDTEALLAFFEAARELKDPVEVEPDTIAA